MAGTPCGYLVTIVHTDVVPHEPASTHRLDTVAGVCKLLEPMLSSHGRRPFWNDQMAQESDPALDALWRWRRDPREGHLTLCGYLTRYDIDRVPRALLDAATWEQQRAAEWERDLRDYGEAQMSVHVPELDPHDPVYPAACRWVSVDYDDRYTRMYGSGRAKLLGECWGLAGSILAAGAHLLPAGSTRASWALAAARRADTGRIWLPKLRADVERLAARGQMI